jgi:hypothetical protein
LFQDEKNPGKKVKARRRTGGRPVKNKPAFSHRKLVRLAAKWLAARFPIVVTEMATAAGEVPDALGIGRDESKVIECKTSRGDFRADARKRGRRHDSGGLGTHRYYLCAEGVLSADDLPVGWGLLVVNKWGKVRAEAYPMRQERDLHGELLILMSVVRRLGGRARGVSVRQYTIETNNRTTVAIKKAPRTVDAETVRTSERPLTDKRGGR